MHFTGRERVLRLLISDRCPYLQIQDTRYFHRFGQSTIGREMSSKEMTFAELKEKGLPTDPNQYHDPNKFATQLGEG